MSRNVAAYARVSTDDQDAERQRDSILRKYDEDEIDWYVDIESGAKASRDQYQQLRDNVDQYDVITTTEIDRLGRSFSELANFSEELRSRDIDIDATEQPISTVDTDDWMSDMLLNLMIVFADAERKMIQDRVQQGIDKAINDGKRIGKPPFGYDVEDGFLIQKPAEYHRAQEFIRAVKKGRSKKQTADFFNIPQSAYQSILDRSMKNYEIEFDESEWKVKRAKVKKGELDLQPLEND